MPGNDERHDKPDPRLRAELLRYRNLLFDRLTGLPTLPVALGEIRKLIAGSRRTVGVICVDLSQTVGLENSFGWQSTDELIMSLAQLMEVFNDQVMGGKGQLFEEVIRTGSFFLFFAREGLTTEELAEVSQLVREFIGSSAVGRELDTNGFDVNIGYSLFVEDPLIRFERLVYTAARDARDMAVDAEKREEMLQYRELAQIIAGERIRTRFQPIMYLGDFSVLGHEALSLGPPNTIFENAERLFNFAARSEFGHALDRLCRRHAVMVAPNHVKEGQLLFLNTAAVSFSDPSFSADFGVECNVERQNVVLELTERTAIHDLSAFRRTLAAFKDEGFKIAVDDAGAGYSSLSTIAELAPDFLKFDRSMVSRIHESKIKQELLKTLMDMADRTGSRVIAEGIEEAEELEVMRDIGVELGQGYYLERPSRAY
ncbi:MAG TPA: EAL domain-containing protein [Candidatus Coatesbacteria bacterium]|nr:EAL domain-containing protein [Candidatus Coatesbacteria bacterium]